MSAGMKRWLPLSGVAFVALVVVSVVGFGGTTPDSGAPAAEVASFYEKHEVRQALGTFVLAASVPFLLLFGIGLATGFGSRKEGRSSVWGRLLVAGAILAAGAILTTVFVHFALVDGAAGELSPTALQALNSLDGNTWIALTSGLGVMMLGAAGVLVSAGASRRLGWSALVLGIALFVPFADFFAMLLTAVWIVAVGLDESVRRKEVDSAAAPGAA